MRVTKLAPWHPWITVLDSTGREAACFWNDPNDPDKARQLANLFVAACAVAP